MGPSELLFHVSHRSEVCNKFLPRLATKAPDDRNELTINHVISLARHRMHLAVAETKVRIIIASYLCSKRVERIDENR
jgi:hypothetical protein